MKWQEWGPRCGAILLLLVGATSSLATDWTEQRQAMLQAIAQSVRASAEYTGRSTLSTSVMAAMGNVPRDEFVPGEYRHLAYRNSALPIAEGQTISQPLIVALMTDFLEPQAEHIILEVGTGSGYQAAVLSELVKHIYTVEIIPALAESAASLLKKLHYNNITVRTGDGYNGWPEHAPYDGIVVTAAPEHIPPALLKQLKPGGKLIIPVGAPGGHQELLLVEVDANGEIRKRSVLPVRFVPLTGDH